MLRLTGPLRRHTAKSFLSRRMVIRARVGSRAGSPSGLTLAMLLAAKKLLDANQVQTDA